MLARIIGKHTQTQMLLHVLRPATTITGIVRKIHTSTPRASGPISAFIERNYKHFNAASLVDAAKGYNALLEKDGKMFVTLAGAMSTAEMGISLAKLIRAGKIHGICCTGANLEEDYFNLVAHKSYERIPNWRQLTDQDDWDLAQRGLNRVTDTCIPEETAVRRLETAFEELYADFISKNETVFPYEIFYRLIRERTHASVYEIDPQDSWLIAASEADLPIWTPGWEDSTLGNITASMKIKGEIPYFPVKSGLDQMVSLVEWYTKVQADSDIGFFQIGGGIAGDFPICAVPLIQQDLRQDTKYWKYFCQISEAATSYGGYSGAPPNEKIAWGKLEPGAPAFIVESDATIVFPLIAAYVLGE